jgi:WD40 repeat protein
VWRWKDIDAALRDATPRVLCPVYTGHLDRQTMGYRGALLPYSEINAIATTTSRCDRVFLAGGDSIAHAIDLTTQQCVQQFSGGHSDYLHTVQFVNHSQELVTGSEDGTVCLWDARAARHFETLTPQPKGSVSSGPNTRWVGAVATDASETWLACGGGSEKGGFVSMWHLPSRVPIHYTETQASDVHDLAYYHTDLLTVGNAPTLHKWNRSSGALLSSAKTSVPSAQFCVVDPASDLIVLGGYAAQLDVCMMPGVVSFSLALD